jgi:hypothetical protein
MYAIQQQLHDGVKAEVERYKTILEECPLFDVDPKLLASPVEKKKQLAVEVSAARDDTVPARPPRYRFCPSSRPPSLSSRSQPAVFWANSSRPSA